MGIKPLIFFRRSLGDKIVTRSKYGVLLEEPDANLVDSSGDQLNQIRLKGSRSRPSDLIRMKKLDC